MGYLKSKKLIIFLLAFILFFINLSYSKDSNFTINQKHKRFYRYNSTVDLNRILRFNRQSFNRVVSITIHYNMVYSNLGVVWMYNGQEVHLSSLSKGLNQSASFPYNQTYPGDFTLKLTGDKGQIQMASISATLAKGIKPITKVKSKSQVKIKKTRLKIKKNVQTFQQAKFFKIVSPAGSESWEVNKTATIYWNSAGIKGKLACELFKDRNKISLLSRNISVNKKSYQWKVAGKDITPGRGYQIRLTTLSDKKSYVSKPFSITEDFKPGNLKKYTLQLKIQKSVKTDPAPTTPIKLKVLSPKYQDKWHMLQEYTIRWESEGLSKDDDIGIALKQISKKNAKIIGISKNTGEFTFQVPYPRIFYGYDIRVILTPLKDRSVEVTSDPFAIIKPGVDLIPNSPSISYQMPQRRPKKWWEAIGDIFTGGITFFANEAVEVAKLAANGVTMKVELFVIQKGREILGDVEVECNILEGGYNVVYAFKKKVIPFLKPNQRYNLTFAAPTKPMGLSKGTYTLEVFIDPENRQQEMKQIRKNNRISVEFETK